MKDVLVFSGTTEGRSISRMLKAAGASVHVRVATGFGAEVMVGDGIDDVQAGSCGGADAKKHINSQFMQLGGGAACLWVHPMPIS